MQRLNPTLYAAFNRGCDYTINIRVHDANYILLFSASTSRMRIDSSVKLPMLNWAPIAVANDKSIFKVALFYSNLHLFGFLFPAHSLNLISHM